MNIIQLQKGARGGLDAYQSQGTSPYYTTPHYTALHYTTQLLDDKIMNIINIIQMIKISNLVGIKLKEII